MEPQSKTNNNVITPKLNLIAWEITRTCNLRCQHCRASADNKRSNSELTTAECYKFIDQIPAVGNPILILTGGEPLMREDVFDIAKYAVNKGLRVVMGTNGTLITENIAAKLKNVPVSRVAVSLDFPVAELQDKFRCHEGAFKAAAEGIKALKKAGVEIQVNCTVTKMNSAYLNELLELSLQLGAVAFHPFFLVPTGRGKGLESVELSSQEYEDTLNWIYGKQKELGESIFFKPTDAPHYLRIMKQNQKLEVPNSEEIHSEAGMKNSGHGISRGCLAGTGFCFISHIGDVQGCGYLDIKAGNIRDEAFNSIWLSSNLFKSLRDIGNLKGKCGICEYKRICGGCRARAFESTGDYLEAEPYCVYQPK